jgi:hypothetical protein
LVSHTKEGAQIGGVNRVLRRIFRPKRKEVAGGWRRLHDEELHNLYASLNIIRVIKSRRTRWAGHVTRMGTIRNVYNILIGKLEGKRPLGRPRRRWGIILERILGKQGAKLWTGFIWLRIGTNGVLL